MITDKKLVDRAKKYAAGVKLEEIHPDVAAQAARFTAAVDSGNDYHVQAHAAALMRAVDALGDRNVAPVPAESTSVTQPKPAKKAAAKRAPSRRSKG